MLVVPRGTERAIEALTGATTTVERRPCLSTAAHLKGVRAPRPRVVIAGGGVAAIEALLALRHIVGEQVSIPLLAPERSFVHRPSSVAEPFGLGGPAPIDLAAIARDQGAELRRGALDADRARTSHRVTGGEALPYDVLVVAVGAVPTPAVPGALTFAGPAQAADVAAMLDRVERRELRRLVFAVPAESTWSLPVYELAMMAAVDLRDRGVTDATLGVVTPEPEPLRLFGAAAGAAHAGDARRARHLAVDGCPAAGAARRDCSTSSQGHRCAPTR